MESSEASLRRTKIVATIGPSSETEEILTEMIQAGLDIARFNTKHNQPAWHVEKMRLVRKVATSLGKKVPILLDLQGPEIRINTLNSASFKVKKDDVVRFTSQLDATQPQSVEVPQNVIDSLNIDNQILLADGSCEFKVIEKSQNALHARASYECEVHPRKTMNTPGIVLEMPSLLPKDLEYIEGAKTEDLEYVALSFVRDRRDIEQLRAELAARNMKSQIVAKIENQAALNNLQEIISSADAIMIARGDLGVEIPYYEVPHWQKIIIQECRKANKMVITATQMLLSMTKNPRPTRAEVSDVANAVYDGTSAVMLSEETASGSYPIKAVEAQAQIVVYHEKFV
jgi:pyruvate kinase